MAELEKATLRIRWIRSGTGFSRKQKEIIRSLGLRRLNHVVERPGTAQVRGLIARVSHLVEVVDNARHPASVSVPEYVILPPEAAGNEATHEPGDRERATDGPEESTG